MTLARTLRGLDREAEAAPILRRVLRAREASLGPDNAEVSYDRVSLALSLAAQGQTARADSLMRLSSPILLAHNRQDAHNLGAVRQDQGRVVVARGDLASAERHYRAALADYARAGDVADRRNGTAVQEMAEVLDAAGRPAEALRLVRSAYSLDDPDVPASVRSVAGSVLAQTGHARRGVAMSRAAAREIQTGTGDESWRTARARLYLGRALRASGRASEGDAMIAAAQQRLGRLRGAQSMYATRR